MHHRAELTRMVDALRDTANFEGLVDVLTGSAAREVANRPVKSFARAVIYGAGASAPLFGVIPAAAIAESLAVPDESMEELKAELADQLFLCRPHLSSVEIDSEARAMVDHLSHLSMTSVEKACGTYTPYAGPVISFSRDLNS